MRRAAAALLALALLAATPAAAQSPVVATVDGAGTVTRAQFDHWMRIAAISAAGPDADARRVRVPRRGTPRFDDLRGQVMQLLVQNLWVAGEARLQGVAVTEAEVRRAYREQKRQSFTSERDFRRFLRQSGFTRRDILYRVRLEQLSNRVRAKVVDAVPPPTGEEVRAAYDADPEQWRVPERRTVRIAVRRTRAAAVAARRQLAAGRGALVSRVVRGKFPPAVFRARRGVSGGPVRWGSRWLVFRVLRIHPARQRPFEAVEDEVRDLVLAERQQVALDAFIDDFSERWRAATSCRRRYATADCGRVTR